MKITLNGKPYEAETEQTIAGLLEQTGHVVAHVAVEVNEEIVPKSKMETLLKL